MSKKEIEADVPVDTSRWLQGTGNDKATVMVVFDRPTNEEARTGFSLHGDSRTLMKAIAVETGINLSKLYYTYAVKFRHGKNVPIKDIKLSAPYLAKEIETIKPKIIIAMGRVALDVLYADRPKVSFSNFRGMAIDYTETIKVFPTFSIVNVLKVPKAKSDCLKDWKDIALLIQKGSIQRDKITTFVINNIEDLKFIINAHLSDTSKPVSLDLEWHGKHWMDVDRYIRTLQFTNEPTAGAVVEFYDEHKNPMIDVEKAWEVLAEFLQDPRVKLMGHNIISDGEWLLAQGIDIRDNVVYDTMLAEHTINLNGPFGLEELTTKYTNLGRYDKALLDWKAAGGDYSLGYGKVPRDILNPYGAYDVAGPLQIMKAQLPALKPFMEPRGEYPSLWDTVLHTQKTIYEIEMMGMTVDRARLDELIKVYHDKLDSILTKLKKMAAADPINIEDFNFRSSDQVKLALFTRLKIPPLRTTDGKSWEWISHQNNDVIANANPSTDKTTLDIIQNAHPFVRLLMDARKVSYVCSKWLRTAEEDANSDETTTDGGIIAKTWADGRLHASFSQLKETARFSSYNMNMQNWPKRAEGAMARIFEEDYE